LSHLALAYVAVCAHIWIFWGLEFEK